MLDSFLHSYPTSARMKPDTFTAPQEIAGFGQWGDYLPYEEGNPIQDGRRRFILSEQLTYVIFIIFSN